MYVKKFSANSLSDALAAVKKELGPEAIIIKTITNKGIKGAIRKKKYEVTAAITEENYKNKARVDSVIDNDNKEKFYKNPAAVIQKSIKEYALHAPAKSAVAGYDQLGLNKPVRQANSALDDFLKEDVEEVKVKVETKVETKIEDEIKKEVIIEEEEVPTYIEKNNFQNDEYEKQNTTLELERLTVLEERVEAIGQSLQNQDEETYQGLVQLRTSLKCIGLNEKFLQELVKRAMFELKQREFQDYDLVNDFALRVLHQKINTELPLFSTVLDQNNSVITILLSEVSTGQTNTMLKLGAMLSGSLQIIYNDDEDHDSRDLDLAKKMLKSNIIEVKDMANLINVCRKNVQEGRSIFIDIKNRAKVKGRKEEIKTLIENFTKSFKNVEVLGVVSAIHSEKYNSKMLLKYRNILNGVIITYLDSCLEFGELFNLHYLCPEIPLKFYCTGSSVPDDIESATSERLIAGMFDI